MVKLLIVKLGAIGDVLRTTSLLPGLTEKYRTAQIDWLTSKISRELLLNNPLINKTFVWEERADLAGYDVVIGLEDDREVCEFVSQVQAKEIIGAYLKDNKQTYTPSALPDRQAGWFDMSMISKHGIERANELKKRNRKTYQQHMAELLGIKISPYVFSLTPDEIEYGAKFVRELGVGSRENIVGINTGSGGRWPQKSWGIEQTIDLIKMIKDELGLVSLILGGEQESERNALIARETGVPDTGSHSIRHFASIINQCKIVLSSDSLAMHLAIALRKRLVVFFGPTSAAEIELYGLGEKLSAPMACSVCYKKECDLKPNCMDAISVDEVFDALKLELNKLKSEVDK